MVGWQKSVGELVMLFSSEGNPITGIYKLWIFSGEIPVAEGFDHPRLIEREPIGYPTGCP